MFLVPKKVKIGEDIWFLKKVVGKNTLRGTMRTLVEAIGIKIKERIITNKTMCRIGIFYMEEAGILVEKGMHIIGHHDAKSYTKYKANDSEVDDRVCQDVISGMSLMVARKYVHFEYMLQREKEKQNLLKVIYVINSLNVFCF